MPPLAPNTRLDGSSAANASSTAPVTLALMTAVGPPPWA